MSLFAKLFTSWLLLACIFASMSCKANKWYGTFEGTATESSQISRTQSSDEMQHFPAGRSTTNIKIKLMREGSVAFVVINDDCKLRLTLNDASHARISEGQTCGVKINGYDGKVNMTGQAYFDADNKLMIQFTGTAAEPGTSGGYAFNFQGQRTE
jgi:hypothetical protein